MPSIKNNRDWNELEFISWEEFREMAPSIIQLEISRIGEIIDRFQADLEFHNALVKSRFELKKFIECLAHSGKDSLEENCAGHLCNAIVNLTFETPGVDEKSTQIRDYILDRLNYVHNRISLIY
jgi:hypothetical protein